MYIISAGVDEEEGERLATTDTPSLTSFTTSDDDDAPEQNMTVFLVVLIEPALVLYF